MEDPSEIIAGKFIERTQQQQEQENLFRKTSEIMASEIIVLNDFSSSGPSGNGL